MVVDLEIPGINGLDFAGRQGGSSRTDRSSSDGLWDMNSTVEAMRAGAYDYLTKPVDPDRLLQTLRKADERRRLIIEIVPYSVG
jgi:two-component system C4-dicarboxylate transport response regulator DctD